MKLPRLFFVNTGYRTHLYPFTPPPIGILSIAAYLRSKMPVDIHVINQRLHNMKIETIVQNAVRFQPDIIGLSVLTAFSYLLPEMCAMLKAALPGVPILVGGPYAAASAEEALKKVPVDVLVPGEGELATEAIVRAWQEGSDFEHIPGICWRKSDGSIQTNAGDLPILENLDSLPLPAYDLIDLSNYWRVQSATPVPPHRYAPLVTSRGCPYKCFWCHNIFGKKLRACSAGRIMEEITFLKRNYAIDHFEFYDDIFNFHSSRVLEFCELLQRQDFSVKLAFPNGLRADLLTPEIIDSLIGAGMYQASFSMETATPRLQKMIGKFMDVPKLLTAGEYAVSKKIYCHLLCMLGFPTETEEEIKDTIETACSSPFHTASFSTVTPFPGTPLYEQVRAEYPEKLVSLTYDRLDCSGTRINLTNLPDDVLFRYQRIAMRRFYLNPKRLFRLLRHHPKPHRLPAYLPIFLYRATKGITNARPLRSK